MKKVIIILSAATIAVSCSGQTNNHNTMNNNVALKLTKAPVTVGLGTLDISFDLPVPLYRTENDKTPVNTLTFRRDDEGAWHYETTNLQSFRPYKMVAGDTDKEAKAHIGHGLTRMPPVLAFRVLEANDRYFRVVVDEESFATVVIFKNPDYAAFPQRGSVSYSINNKPVGYYIYETWEHLLLRAVSVVFREHLLYDTPDGTKIFEEKKSERVNYKVTEVRGDWVKVKNRRNNFEGWAKWKNDMKILVEIVEYVLM
jgi:hypothetical protein